MLASDQHSHPYRAKRKHTVRIVKPKSAYRAPLFSFLAVAFVAVLAVGLWRVFSPAEVAEVKHRDIHDVVLDWRCDNGHYFEADGVNHALPCEKCGKDSYPVETYYCQEHGRYPVSSRFDSSSEGLRVEARRISDGDWKPVDEGLFCPRCSKPLRKKRRDPLAKSVRDKRKLDGSRSGRRN